MYATSLWSDYLTAAAISLMIYYGWFVYRFHRRQIKALAVSGGEIWTGQSRGHPADQQVADGAQTEANTLAGDRRIFSELIGLGAQLTNLIEEAHQKRYDAAELSLLLQMVFKDYPGIRGKVFQAAINGFIDNQCAKYGSIHLSEKDKELIWDQV